MLASERLRRWLKLGFAIAFSAVFMALFLRSVDLHEVGRAFRDADYRYVVPAMALFSLSVVCRSVRWRYFFLPGFDLTWRQLLPSVLIGYAGNNLLPLRAGELVRAQYLSDRFAIARMQTFGGLLMERLFDGLVLAAFVLWGLLLADAGAGYLGLALALGSATLAGFVVCTLAALNPTLPQRIAALPLPMPDRVRQEIAGLGGSFLGGFSVLTSVSSVFWAAVWSAAAWGLE